jgi:hypothetical protein
MLLQVSHAFYDDFLRLFLGLEGGAELAQSAIPCAVREGLPAATRRKLTLI